MTKLATNTRDELRGLKSAFNNSVAVIRSQWQAILGKTHGGARDLYAAFGYKHTLTVEDFEAMYLRNDIANRIVCAFPQATWADEPNVGDENGEEGESSPFHEAWEELCKRFNVMSYLERADRLCGVGQYSILVMGFADGRPLSEPLGGGRRKLMYLQPYGQRSAQIVDYDRDPASPRYGLPIMYQVTPQVVSLSVGAPQKTSTRVHWTRVLHVSEYCDESDVFGTPRLMPLYNRLTDLEKVVGGSAECFWLTANRGMFLGFDKDGEELSPAEEKSFKEQLEEFQHGLRRHLMGRGVETKVLGSEDPDPSKNADVLLKIIAGAAGIPLRILTGSEQGQLASTQDEASWSSRIDERRNNFAATRVLTPFVQKMIDTGNLPRPAGKWCAEWEHTDLGEQAAADILVKRTQALVSYSSSPNAELVVPMKEYRRDFLNIAPESDYEPESVIQPDEVVDENDPNLQDPDKKDAPAANVVVNMEARPLYVSRRVLNTKDINAWAKKQGFKNIERDLHVTICYSRTPVDWMKAREAWDQDENGGIRVTAGGPRVVELLGKGAIVLSFASEKLLYRHYGLREMCGASHDWDVYQPHITISYNEPGLDVSKIEAYTGAIMLGPEIFRDLKD